MKTGWGIKTRLEQLDEFFYGQAYIDARERHRAPDGTFNRTDVVMEICPEVAELVAESVAAAGRREIADVSPEDLDADEAERAERAGA